MINNFKKPDLKAPRYRNKVLSLLNAETINAFKEQKPMYANIENSKLKEIIRLYNKALGAGIIDHRDGVELPDSLGYLFLGTCPPAKSVNVDYSLSKEYGKTLRNKNWETDGNIAKIFYTNWSTKYRFKNRELWSFAAGRTLKRTVAANYPENWTKYLKMKNKFRIAQLYSAKSPAEEIELASYNEFEM